MNIFSWWRERRWVDLTDEEMSKCFDEAEWNDVDWCPDHMSFARAVIAAFKAKQK